MRLISILIMSASHTTCEAGLSYTATERHIDVEACWLDRRLPSAKWIVRLQSVVKSERFDDTGDDHLPKPPFFLSPVRCTAWMVHIPRPLLPISHVATGQCSRTSLHACRLPLVQLYGRRPNQLGQVGGLDVNYFCIPLRHVEKRRVKEGGSIWMSCSIETSKSLVNLINETHLNGQSFYVLTWQRNRNGPIYTTVMFIQITVVKYWFYSLFMFTFGQSFVT